MNNKDFLHAAFISDPGACSESPELNFLPNQRRAMLHRLLQGRLSELHSIDDCTDFCINHLPPPPLCIAVYVYNCIQRQIIVLIVCYNLINFSKARAASQRHPTYVSPKCKSNVHSPACAWYFKLHFILIANCKFDKLDGILSMTKAPFQNQMLLCHCIFQPC